MDDRELFNHLEEIKLELRNNTLIAWNIYPIVSNFINILIPVKIPEKDEIKDNAQSN